MWILLVSKISSHHELLIDEDSPLESLKSTPVDYLSFCAPHCNNLDSLNSQGYGTFHIDTVMAYSTFLLLFVFNRGKN